MVADAFITDLKTIFDDAAIADATVESLVDAVIDELNLYGLSLDNMAGVAGSKTITLASSEKAAVRRIFRVMYASWHKNAAANASVNVGAIGVTLPDLISRPEVQAMINQTASLLLKASVDPPIYIRNSPTE